MRLIFRRCGALLLAAIALILAAAPATAHAGFDSSDPGAAEWGRTLIAKTLIVAAAAGGYNHHVLIPKLQATPDDPVLTHRFRTIVTGEALALIAVVVATALLMGAAS